MDQHGEMSEAAAAARPTPTRAVSGPPPAPAAAPTAVASARPPRSAARKTLRRSIKILLFLFVLYQFGLPALGGLRKAVNKLAQVNAFLLVAGLGLELLALFAYSQLTRAALPRDSVPLARLTRIQVATKALTNVVPGGSAAGSALGYRLLTMAGVRGSDAGFALATAGLGSAVVLNVLLWVVLLVSIPFSGVNPVYVSVALVGLLVLGSFAGIVVALMKGQRQAERVVRAVARRVRWMDEDRMGHLVQRLAARIRDLLTDRELVQRVVIWAVANWLLDAASLWVFLRAFGGTVRPDSLVVAFCVANVFAAIPITPGGLGVVDTILPAMLVFFGVDKAVAGLGFSTYRIAQFWLPIPLGTVSYFTLRFGPWRIDREHELASLRKEAEEIVEEGVSVYDWVETYGHRSATPPAMASPVDAGGSFEPPSSAMTGRANDLEAPSPGDDPAP
jgi:uncharacterized protein (TIRG00374 family)